MSTRGEKTASIEEIRRHTKHITPLAHHGFPKGIAEIPRVELIFQRPPIVQPMRRLQQHLGSGGPFLWICREDCNSGLAFGGNKVRKLEYVLHDAIQQGADTIVTTGGVQSNHLRQTAAAAAQCGLKTVIVPKDMVDPEDPQTYRAAGNVQLNSILGAQTLSMGTATDDAMQALREEGRVPYFIPTGASKHPLGGLGYTKWMLEVADLEVQMERYFDTILCVVAGGSTLAGLVVGSKLAQAVSNDTSKRRRLIGISVFAQPAKKTSDIVLEIARTTCEKVGLDTQDVSESDFMIFDQYTAGSYGRLNAATTEAVKLVAQLEGILLDPVYTGKAMVGMLDLLRVGQLSEASNVLFLHTGGQPALSAYPILR